LQVTNLTKPHAVTEQLTDYQDITVCSKPQEAQTTARAHYIRNMYENGNLRHVSLGAIQIMNYFSLY